MNKLETILYDLKSHKRDKVSIISEAIETRLNKSLKSYYEELIKTSSYLELKDGKKILKNIGG